MCWALKDNNGDKKKSELVNLAAGCGSRKVRLKRGQHWSAHCARVMMSMSCRERDGGSNSQEHSPSQSVVKQTSCPGLSVVSPLTTALCSRHLTVTLEAHVEVYLGCKGQSLEPTVSVSGVRSRTEAAPSSSPHIFTSSCQLSLLHAF